MRKRKSLHAEFNAAKQENLPLPRQNYGIDFYGHHSGNILVAIDLVTREITLWFMKTRKQETVAKALLAGLVFTKGVPLSFRSDEASEFVHGVVAAMNAYLGVTQITTGGHNARGNATVERVMHSLGHMLRTAPQTDYKNIGEHVHCMAFAHNCTYSSVIQNISVRSRPRPRSEDHFRSENGHATSTVNH
jgi:transposase InsO family protein